MGEEKHQLVTSPRTSKTGEGSSVKTDTNLSKWVKKKYIEKAKMCPCV
jgi:hypothetical protein